MAVGQAAVHGLGGIGKTELVARYASARKDRYRLVWWITADTPATIALGLAGLTRRLHPVATLADAQEWAVGWLQSHVDWLLVLDNVEDIAHIRDLLGLVAGQGQVVVTTRRDLGTARWRQLGLRTLRLGVLDRTASVDLLIRLTGLTDPAGADRVAEVLGDLPLALEQAAAYIGQHHGLTFDGYRHRLENRFDRISREAGEGGRSQRTIGRVWQVTVDAVTTRRILGDDHPTTHVVAENLRLAPHSSDEEDWRTGLTGSQSAAKPAVNRFDRIGTRPEPAGRRAASASWARSVVAAKLSRRGPPVVPWFRIGLVYLVAQSAPPLGPTLIVLVTGSDDGDVPYAAVRWRRTRRPGSPVCLPAGSEPWER